MSDLPAITGKQLIGLLVKDGWEIRRKMNHGMGLSKHFPKLDRNLVTCIPDKKRPLSKSTLGQILGPDQTRIGRKGLESLIKKYGID
ncbi:hypothetical protein ACFL6H_04895 [Candidatus Latescibacterota bacterium]